MSIFGFRKFELDKEYIYVFCNYLNIISLYKMLDKIQIA